MKFSINWRDDSYYKEKQEKLKDIGLLVLRLLAAGMMLFGHGFDKLVNFSAKAETFADPIGFGPVFALVLAVFAEFFCSVAILFGFMTRYAAIPLVITMLVAAFVIHSDDPWSKKEFALIYLVPFLTILIAGAGRYSVDARIFGGRHEHR